jgi:hypothetical protein
MDYGIWDRQQLINAGGRRKPARDFGHLIGLLIAFIASAVLWWGVWRIVRWLAGHLNW